MLQSMTGFGEARFQDDSMSVLVELRSVNNRHFKLSVRVSEPYGALEPDLERIVREAVHRGTIQLTLRVERPRRSEEYRLNRVALGSYRSQLVELTGKDVDLGVLLALPGVVEDRRPASDDPHDDWPKLRPIVAEALARFQDSRAEEGRAMAAELKTLGRDVADRLRRIADRRPEVVSSYQDRLGERVQALVAKHGVTVEPRDLIREVAIFAERSDIAEEITRLRAHFEQYESIIDGPQSAGRKLEFVVQEMGREINTIGSKASDTEISRDVVEIKGTLERIRELIQNVE